MIFTKILPLFYVMLEMTRGTWRKVIERNIRRISTVERERPVPKGNDTTSVMGSISHERRIVKVKTLNWCCLIVVSSLVVVWMLMC